MLFGLVSLTNCDAFKPNVMALQKLPVVVPLYLHYVQMLGMRVNCVKTLSVVLTLKVTTQHNTVPVLIKSGKREFWLSKLLKIFLIAKLENM